MSLKPWPQNETDVDDAADDCCCLWAHAAAEAISRPMISPSSYTEKKIRS